MYDPQNSGSGGAAGEALDPCLSLLQHTPPAASCLATWAALPTPGPTLVSGCMTAYCYNQKVKASGGAKAGILEVLAALLRRFPAEMASPDDVGKRALGSFSATWLLREGEYIG